MILFKPEHVALILAGTKTQTRRTGKRRWKVGGEHLCYTRPPFAKGGAEPFCSVRITAVRSEPLRRISHADCLAEGYDSIAAYFEAFARIYGLPTYQRYLDEPLWVVEFERVVT